MSLNNECLEQIWWDDWAVFAQFACAVYGYMI